MSIVSNNIKYLRRINGLTQEQFSRRIGIKRSLLGAYEEARANPNLDNLKLMASVFGVSVDALIKSDIRKLKETPDISFEFEPKKTEPVFSFESAPRNSNSEPKSLSELMQGVPNPVLREQIIEKPIEIFTKPQTIETRPQAVQEPIAPKIENGFKLVKKHQLVDYVRHYKNDFFINSLESISLPFIQKPNLRAFQAGEDFDYENAYLICQEIMNVNDIVDGKNYLLVSKMNGLMYRRVYNQVKIKGSLLLSIDKHALPSQEVAVNEIIEFWEVVAFISLDLPKSPPNLSKVVNLLDQMKSEIDRIK
jgi:transcriptional regulator with XRE-family HTH domain